MGSRFRVWGLGFRVGDHGNMPELCADCTGVS